MELLAHLAAFCALLVAGGAFVVAIRARAQVVEPIELRRQLATFDQALSEHESRLRAYYARLRKRDQTLTETLIPAQEALGAEGEGSDQGEDKAVLWERARALRAARGH